MAKNEVAVQQPSTLSGVEALIAAICKKHGPSAVIPMGAGRVVDVPVVSTGSLSLDIALGCGGLPRGRIVEVAGPESAGKTTLTLHVIAEAQREGGLCAFVDAEHALDVGYAGKLGVDLDRLLVSQPDCGEQALEIVNDLVDSRQVDVVVVDSVAALTPRAEIDGEMGEAHMGLHARLMSQAMRKLVGTASKSGTLVVFVNQLRMKVGIVFGNPEVTTGGNALKFYSSVRLDVRKRDPIKEGTGTDIQQVGNKTHIKVVKNKLAPPFREVDVEILYGQGIDTVGDLLNLAVEHGLVGKAGAWFSLGSERLGQGFANAKEALRRMPEAMKMLDEAVRRKLNVRIATSGKVVP